jgi:hypothetical protein
MRAVTVVVLSCVCLVGLAIEGARACTSFVMDTPEGPYFGCNLDLFIPGDGLVMVNPRGVEKEGLYSGTTGRTIKWVSEYGSVTFNVAGNQFVWGGMNEAGLVMSSMELASGRYPKPDERPGLLDGNWGQFVLDTCDNVDEVIATNALMRVQDEEPTSQYLVSDAEGDCAVIEYIDGKFVSYSGKDLPIKALANGRYSRAVAAYERGGPRWWWSNPGRSAERVAACQDRAAGFAAATDTSAVNYAFGTLQFHVAAPHTRWNIVYSIADRELWYRTVRSPAYKHIALSDLDLACEAPRLMLDVNAPLEGDVAGRLVPYDPSINLNVFRTFCERYGIEVTREDSADLMRFFDGFGCAR